MWLLIHVNKKGPQMTNVKHLAIQKTSHTYLGELWDGYCKYFGENLSCYNKAGLYLHFLKQLKQKELIAVSYLLYLCIGIFLGKEHLPCTPKHTLNVHKCLLLKKRNSPVPSVGNLMKCGSDLWISSEVAGWVYHISSAVPPSNECAYFVGNYEKTVMEKMCNN